MVGNIAAQVALLAFAMAIVAGLWAGNTPATVLTRALVTMVVALVVGKLGGGTVKLVLRDHLQRKKLTIDRAHVASIRASQAEESADQSDPIETG